MSEFDPRSLADYENAMADYYVGRYVPTSGHSIHDSEPIPSMYQVDATKKATFDRLCRYMLNVGIDTFKETNSAPPKSRFTLSAMSYVAVGYVPVGEPIYIDITAHINKRNGEQLNAGNHGYRQLVADFSVWSRVRDPGFSILQHIADGDAEGLRVVTYFDAIGGDATSTNRTPIIAERFDNKTGHYSARIGSEAFDIPQSDSSTIPSDGSLRSLIKSIFDVSPDSRQPHEIFEKDFSEYVSAQIIGQAIDIL